MSAQELITDHLDLWTGAITKKSNSGRGSNGKIELTGIKKLRELILELAVSGRLVSQSPEDTLFKELLLRLRRKHAPIKARGRKTVSGDVSGDEQPFDIPRTWTWTRLGEIVEILDSQRKPITKAARKSGPYPYYGASGVVDYVDGYLFDEPLVLVGEDGAKWDKGEATSFSISGKSWVNNHAHVLRPRREAVTDEYLAYYLTAADLNPYITGMTVPKLNQARLASIPVATPCLEEQHRIAQKVDELMALCDRLEQQTSDQLDAHETLVDTLLGTLTQSENANELADNWARLAAHFDTLFTTEQSIDKLKQTILQLAVMGRLVEQDAGDEPVTKLLERISEQKDQLTVSGRKKATLLVDDNEKPFQQPFGWQFKRLGDLAYVFAGNSFKSQDFNSLSGSRVIKITNVGVGELVETQDYLPPGFEDEYEKYQVRTGDLILALTRPYISTGLKVAICPDSYNQALINQRVAAIRPFMDRSFIYIYMQSKYVLGLYQARFGGSGLQPNLKMDDVTNLIIPVPPLEEQQRIVQKVDELMALCDQLKERLNQASETRCQLAEAVVEGALS